jgi:molybdate transport system ATP-binding protein
MLLSLENTSVKRFGKTLFDDFSWKISPGESWAIVGPMGSGKSSLIELVRQKAMAKTRLAANDYRQYWQLSRALQYYQQRFNSSDADLAPRVRDFLNDQIVPVGTSNLASVTMPPLSLDQDFLEEKARLLQVHHLLDRRITSLSNGETRRMLLCKALLEETDLLLLDMPFIGLDEVSRLVLHSILNQFNAMGLNIVMATSPQEIPTCISHVLELGNGEIVYHGDKLKWLKFNQNSSNRAEVLDPEKRQKLNATISADFSSFVKMKDVKVRYGSKQVLESVNWQVNAGEKWAILGPNGSGKSTLISLLTADNPQRFANDIYLFGQKIGTGESIWDIRKRMGFVSPELQLYFPRHYSAWAVVASGLFDAGGLYRELKPEQEKQTLEVMDLLKIADLRTRKMYELSNGQQRLALLARALIKNPPVLILDEPCQGLDEMGINFFRDLVQELCADTPRTLIYTTHYPAEIPACVDRFLTWKDGEWLASKK